MGKTRTAFNYYLPAAAGMKQRQAKEDVKIAV